MLEINKQFVDDLCGYMHYGLENGTPAEIMLFQLAHDIQGASQDDKHMLPRTTGYAKHIPKTNNPGDSLLIKVLVNVGWESHLGKKKCCAEKH